MDVVCVWKSAAFASAVPTMPATRVFCLRALRSGAGARTPRRRQRCAALRRTPAYATKGGGDGGAVGDSDAGVDGDAARRELERLFERSPSTGPAGSKADEPLSLGEIRDGGVERIERAADDLKGELADVETETERYAEQLVDEEMGKVLEKYEAQKEGLLLKQKAQIDGIREEALLLQKLALSAQSAKSTVGGLDKRRRYLLALAGMFAIAALVFFWTGITEEDTTSLTYAAVDGLLAAMISYLSVDRSKGKKAKAKAANEDE